MPKQYKKAKPSKNVKTSSNTLNIVMEHYSKATQDMEQRRDRPSGWNDLLDAYHGVLPKNWPYLSEITEPVIRTTILEKTARLFNGRLRGRLVPRDTKGDVVKARLHNAILEYQWDSAMLGGSMIEKWAMMDIQTRLYGASFALIPWHIDMQGEDLIYEGNEMKVLDPRDVLLDYNATHIKNANWVQVREFKQYADLIEENDRLTAMGGKPLYKNLSALQEKLSEGDGREASYDSKIRNIRGLEDRTGDDPAFPVIEVVTEYRKDKWIIFAPQHSLKLAEIENPFDHKQIPVVMLRYYPVPDDMYGESEVESVLPIADAINAVWSGAVDEGNLTMNPPIKVSNADGTVRMDTIVYGPNAVWQTGSSVNNVQEHQSSGAFVRNFQTLYSSLKSAFNSAMGDSSLGVSNDQPFDTDKTATEVRAVERQKLSRDQYNQLYLEQALKDQMMFWLKNNQQFLFSDPEKKVHILRIVGNDKIKDLQRLELDEMTHDSEAIAMISDLVRESGGEVTDEELEQYMKLAEVPTNPVIYEGEEGTEVKPKMEVDEQDETGTLYLLPEDLTGTYDYIPDVQSLALGAEKEKKDGRNNALQLALNDAVDQRLAKEGYSLQLKDLVVSVLQDSGYKDADKFIKQIQNEPTGQGTVGPAISPTGIPEGQGVPPSSPDVAGNTGQPIPQPQGQEVPPQPI